MTAETTYKLCRAYKLFYAGTYDFRKYKGHLKVAPLIQQPDRRFYYRIAQKLNDAQIHALFAVGYFFRPHAYVADFATDEAFRAAVAFRARIENGRPLLEQDLYTLRKTLTKETVDTWLYGQWIGSTREAIPPCCQQILEGTLPLDLACALLLIPQPHLQYHWAKHWETADPLFSGAVQCRQLLKLDRLITFQWPGWRALSHDLAKTFWNGLNVPTLAAVEPVLTPTLY